MKLFYTSLKIFLFALSIQYPQILLKNNYLQSQNIPGQRKLENIQTTFQTNRIVDSARVIKYTSIDFLYKYKYDSNGLITEWNTERFNGESFVKSTKSTYEYNVDKKIISTLVEFWQDTVWVNDEKSTYTYNDEGILVTYLNQYWIGADWRKTSLETYTYDSNGNLILFLSENNYKISYLFGANGNLITFLSSYYSDTTWINWQKVNYYYDNNRNLEYKLTEEWQKTDWVNYMKENYFYDGKGKKISQLIAMWKDTTWVDIRREHYSYDSAENLLFYLIERWDGTNWKYSEKETNIYDSNGNLIEKLFATWNNYDWDPVHKISCVYDSEGNITVFISEHMINNWLLGDWDFNLVDKFGNNFSIEVAKIEIFYKNITNYEDVKITEDKFDLYQNFPNPFNPKTNIEYSITKSQNVNVSIYDILGRKVEVLVNEKQQVGKHKIEFDGSKLPSGIYFYELTSGEFRETKKLLLLK